MNNSNTIFDEIEAERVEQNKQWGGAEHDDKHSFADFNRFIRKQCFKLDQQLEIFGPAGPVMEARRILIKIAALAVAAIESIDRKLAGGE